MYIHERLFSSSSSNSVKQYDTSLLMEKIEQSLENMVNGVMQAGNMSMRHLSIHNGIEYCMKCSISC
jgi:hypothetical protein